MFLISVVELVYNFDRNVYRANEDLWSLSRNAVPPSRALMETTIRSKGLLGTWTGLAFKQ